MLVFLFLSILFYFFLWLLKLITKINFLFFCFFFFAINPPNSLPLVQYRKLPFVKALPIQLPRHQTQTYGICQQRLNVQQQPRGGQQLQPPRHEELGQRNHPFIIPRIHLMAEAEIILAIVMGTIQFIAVAAVPHSQPVRQHAVHHHRALHSTASFRASQISYPAIQEN